MVGQPLWASRLRDWPWGHIAYVAIGLFAVASVASDIKIIAVRDGMPVPLRAVAIAGELLLLVCLALAGRYPRWAAVAGITAMAASLVAWYLPVGMLCLAVVVFIGAVRADAVIVAAITVAVVGWLGVAAYLEPRVWQGLAWVLPLLVVVPAVGGWALGVTRRRRDAAELRVDALEKESTRVRERERQVLARELHDVVSHGLTLISMQAAVMRITTDVDQLETARAAIERSSRESLDELKRLLKVLRASDVITDESAALHDVGVDESRGIAEVVQRLASDLRGVGHAVEVVCVVGSVPHSVELAADRVLREAVTNIVKHGGVSTTCALTVREVTGALHIDVANDVRTEHLADLGSTRLGIVGLVERVELLGGSLIAGLDGGRWHVRAKLPLS
ncbi:MAG: histidine kinase [Micrococcales bacterium]|nr:histidine kinase [Micrococcales bacterium]